MASYSSGEESFLSEFVVRMFGFPPFGDNTYMMYTSNGLGVE